MTPPGPFTTATAAFITVFGVWEGMRGRTRWSGGQEPRPQLICGHTFEKGLVKARGTSSCARGYCGDGPRSYMELLSIVPIPCRETNPRGVVTSRATCTLPAWLRWAAGASGGCCKPAIGLAATGLAESRLLLHGCCSVCGFGRSRGVRTGEQQFLAAVGGTRRRLSSMASFWWHTASPGPALRVSCLECAWPFSHMRRSAPQHLSAAVGVALLQTTRDCAGAHRHSAAVHARPVPH